MKYNFSLVFLLLFYSISHSQIGINTSNPKGSFHVDGAKNNPASTDPNVNQQKDDFIINSTGTVGIGTINPSPFSSLEIQSDKGLRLPQLTLAQRTALDTIPTSELTKKDGLTIYNTTTNCINYWANDKWLELCNPSSCEPVTGIPVISPANPNLQVGVSTIFTVSGVDNAIEYIWKVNNSIQKEQIGSYFNYTPTDTNSVTISVIAKGCDNSQTIESYTTTTNPTIVCKNLSGTLIISPKTTQINPGSIQPFTATGVSNAIRYVWKVNNQIVQDGTSSTYNFTATSEGSSTISVTAYGECGDYQTDSSNQGSISSNFACATVGRWVKAGTQCKNYYLCTISGNYPNLQMNKSEMSCPGTTQFDQYAQQCLTAAFSCPF